jgi:CTP synthase
MEQQKDVTRKGGTMRLGDYPCVLKDGTLARKVYGRKQVLERHRHRYEFNNAYREQLEAKGLVCSGASPDERLVEMIELRDHPWFVATQAHPEFKSRPMDCHPLFKGFIKAALVHSAQRRQPAKSKLKVVKG